MKLNLPIDIEKVKGFLDPLEGEASIHFTQKLQLRQVLHSKLEVIAENQLSILV